MILTGTLKVEALKEKISLLYFFSFFHKISDFMLFLKKKLPLNIHKVFGGISLIASQY